jgi:HK97 family phage prohead protease
MADENVIRREFQAELVPVGDGRTIDLRIVPYNTVARVRDPGGPAYEEEWLPGVFDKQVKAANRVFVNVEHEQGFSGVVGRGQEFGESADGFVGSVRILSGPDGDKALELVHDRALTGVSVEAIPIKSQRTADGVVQRVKARLLNIALCRNPAFTDAQVLAVREAPTYVVNFGGEALPPTSANTTLGANWTATNPVFTPDMISPEHLAEREEPEPEPEPEPAPVPEPEPDSSRVEQVLSRIGYQNLAVSEVTDQSWDSSVDRFEDDQYERSCLVVLEGDEPIKSRGRLPVLEPDGALNVKAMREAATRLNLTGLKLEQKGQAARKLVRYYRRAGETPPPALLASASR